MCAYITFGGQPTEERIRPILQAIGAEEARLTVQAKSQYKEKGEDPSQHRQDGKFGGKATHSLARLLAEYADRPRGQARYPPAGDQGASGAAERLEAGGRGQPTRRDKRALVNGCAASYGT